jgi:hypothetical protein
MTYDELANLKLVSPTSLTKVDDGKSPVASTVIDRDMIRRSGARNLLHLLEIYVPGLIYQNHAINNPHIGMRGIISDRDDKYRDYRVFCGRS